MTETTEKQEIAYDPWDSTGMGMWFVHLDPTTLEGLWSEEQDTLYVNRDDGGYWLGKPGVMGQSQYPTLEAAKAAGAEVVKAREEGLAAAMLKDAGLDPAVWAFEYENGARFKHRENPEHVIEIDIEGTNVRNRFGAFDGEAEIGEYANAGDAADALVNRPAPGI